jgi:hypothetical protein
MALIKELNPRMAAIGLPGQNGIGGKEGREDDNVA